jgi:hypothetical protein
LSLKRPTIALLLASLLAAPVLTAIPANAAPANRAECRLLDPMNLTAFCKELHEIDLWRQQIMDGTGPTVEDPSPIGPVGPPAPPVEEAAAS